MNLIEQLGGYESAKSKFRDNGSLHAERLKKALLEYRAIAEKLDLHINAKLSDLRIHDLRRSLGSWRMKLPARTVILAVLVDSPRHARTRPAARMPLFSTPFAQLDLIRQPDQANDPLQAFDAADEYLLNHLHEQGLAADARVLLLNDGFGALACALAPHCRVTSSGDSFLGALALHKNLPRNGLAPAAVP